MHNGVRQRKTREEKAHAADQDIAAEIVSESSEKFRKPEPLVIDQLSSTLARFFGAETELERQEPVTPPLSQAGGAVRFVDVLQYLCSLADGHAHALSARHAGFPQDVVGSIQEVMIRQIPRLKDLGFQNIDGGVSGAGVTGFIRNRLAEMQAIARSGSRKRQHAILELGHQLNSVFARNIYPESVRPSVTLHSIGELELVAPAVRACFEGNPAYTFKVIAASDALAETERVLRKLLKGVSYEVVEGHDARWHLFLMFESRGSMRAYPKLLQLALLSAVLVSAANRP